MLENSIGAEGAELCTAGHFHYRPVTADGMMMNSVISDYPRDTTWFAVRTRSRQEKVAASALEALGVPNFLPLTSEVHRWSDRKQTVTIPLFSGYLFVRMNLARESKLRVLQTPGVSGLVGNQTGPLPIPDAEIENVRTVLAQEPQCSPYPFLTVGERVRVVRGALSGIEGTLVRSQSDFKLVISVELIQQSIAVNIHAADVQPASDPTHHAM